jgi:hypothetical protein
MGEAWTEGLIVFSDAEGKQQHECGTINSMSGQLALMQAWMVAGAAAEPHVCKHMACCLPVSSLVWLTSMHHVIRAYHA